MGDRLIATATRTSRYERKLDSVFGRVERFVPVHEHRVQIQIGRSYFTSTKVYASAEGARQAAARLNDASLTALEKASE